ncbi:CLUMA_CG009624, isoform A [Clunio marinus]|uniref:CLUMA_CG009624, isoform A n=1 Tax=Clunio marinus TaxID=568069 RepID=A0A1J1I7N1_9DIPT|nr:CLUMA_CG009624, isoform A [Clunio marinus]
MESESNCRFCMKIFQDDDKQIVINPFIKAQFFWITHKELNVDLYSQYICEYCFNTIKEFAEFRDVLIKNQNCLENSFIFVEENVDLKNSTWNNTQDYNTIIEVLNEVNDEDKNSHSETEILMDKFLDENSHKSQEHSQKNRFLADSKINLNGTKLCSECGKVYKSYSSYHRHFERIHLQVKNFECDYCSYRCYTRDHMEIHVKSHLKIKTHYCELCGKAFGNGSILRQHFLTHQNKRPYTCEKFDCNFSFKSIYALRRHQKTHSLGKRKYECEVCSSKFNDKWHLERHKQTHENAEISCEKCGKFFKNVYRLEAHQAYHNPPQYQCESCSKEFFTRSTLISHLRTHSDKKNYDCCSCDKSYYNKSHLTRHIKKEHSTKLNQSQCKRKRIKS